MTSTKTFHIGDILSVTTGKLISPRHIGGVYDILGWMSGEDLMTHQLSRVSRECEGPLREQFPDLAAIEVPGWVNSEETLTTWLAEVTATHGTTREVAPLADGDHTYIDPITEMHKVAPNAEIITVEMPGDGGAER